MDDLEASLRRAMNRRAFLKGAAAAPLAAWLAACTSGPKPTTGPTGPTGPTTATATHAVPTPPTKLPPEARAIAKAIPKEVLERVYNGYFPGMSGEVVTIPLGFNYFDGGISHSTPWPYTTQVPMVWYGPGIIPKLGDVTRPVTSADQAPTLAALTGYTDYEAPDGVPMEEILQQGAPKPKLVVTLVWDAGGTYVLGLHPKNWPNLRKLMAEGVSYTNAHVGSGPSSTAPVHATMGTGTFPRKHGVLDNVQYRTNGSVGDPWKQGPSGLLVPTFADYYGADMGDKVEIATFATLSWHLGMMGKSTEFDGGKRQLAVLRERGGGEGAEGIAWGLSDTQAEYYRYPDYVNDLPDITTYWPFADAADGTKDGKWRGNDIEELKMGFDTPARIPYQTRALEEVMTREGLGHHEGTDLMFINYKLIDEIGHIFTASSVEMADSVRVQDEALPGFIDFLDRQVGKGQWVLLVTADHGHSAAKEVSGGFAIKVQSVEEHMATAFPAPDGATVVARTRPGWSFIDLDELDSTDYSLEDLASDFRGLTKTDTAGKSQEVPPAEVDEEVLLSSFPGSWLPGMIEIASPS